MPYHTIPHTTRCRAIVQVIAEERRLAQEALEAQRRFLKEVSHPMWYGMGERCPSNPKKPNLPTLMPGGHPGSILHSLRVHPTLDNPSLRTLLSSQAVERLTRADQKLQRSMSATLLKANSSMLRELIDKVGWECGATLSHGIGRYTGVGCIASLGWNTIVWGRTQGDEQGWDGWDGVSRKCMRRVGMH